MKCLVSALMIIFGSVSLVSAQSLAEVAKKEKERRKKVEAPSRNEYNENNLRSSLRTPAQSSTASAGATGAASDGETDETSAEPDPAGTESSWRERAAAINKRITDLEAKLKSPEMTTDVQGASKRAAAERDLAQAQADRQTLADEARRKGVPPGWLR